MSRLAQLLLLVVTTSSCLAADKVQTSVNATEFIEGTPVKMSCVIPVDDNTILQWKNVEKVETVTLRCFKSGDCNTYKRYELTRKGQNITLVIKKVNIHAAKWTCSDTSVKVGANIDLNITSNPQLKLILKPEDDSTYTLNTSCSSYPMSIACLVDNVALKPVDVESLDCETPGLHRDIATLKPEKKLTPPRDIVCTLTRNNETVETKYTTDLASQNIGMYIVGGILVVLGLLFFGIGRYYRESGYVFYICCAAVSCVLLGLGFLIINHTFIGSSIFFSLGGIVAVGAILHWLCCMGKTYMETPSNEL